MDVPIERWSRGLKRLRTERKLSQWDVARGIGVDQKTVSRYELGRLTPPDDVKAQLAEYFGVPVSDLFSWEEPVAS